MFNYQIKISSTSILSFLVVNTFIECFFLEAKIVFLPTKIKRLTLIKSPHVHKKSKEHFQIIKYCRLYLITFPSLALLNLFLIKLPSHTTVNLKKIH